MTLFLHRRKVATNAAKHFSPGGTAKTARDFLLHFHHANIPLCLTIVKGNRKIQNHAETQEPRLGVNADDPASIGSPLASGVLVSPVGAGKRSDGGDQHGEAKPGRLPQTAGSEPVKALFGLAAWLLLLPFSFATTGL
jgi:hypothetical protein